MRLLIPLFGVLALVLWVIAVWMMFFASEPLVEGGHPCKSAVEAWGDGPPESEVEQACAEKRTEVTARGIYPLALSVPPAVLWARLSARPSGAT